MNTDWQVKPPSRKSSVSGEPFKPGTKIHCYIFSNPYSPNELQRTDILEEELQTFSPPPNLLARWTRLAKDREDDDQKESQKQILGNAEDFFLSLYDNLSDNPQEDTEKTKDLLKQLLSLMLERKRLLRRLNNKNKESILYLHVPTKKEYPVPKETLELEEIAKIQDQLTVLIR